MGYRIVYGADPFEEKKKKSHLRSLTAGFALAFVILVRLFYPQGAQILREHLLPGNENAIMRLTEDIQAGEPIGEAVTAFCRTIMEEAFGQPD